MMTMIISIHKMTLPFWQHSSLKTSGRIQDERRWIRRWSVKRLPILQVVFVRLVIQDVVSNNSDMNALRCWVMTKPVNGLVFVLKIISLDILPFWEDKEWVDDYRHDYRHDCGRHESSTVAVFHWKPFFFPHHLSSQNIIIFHSDVGGSFRFVCASLASIWASSPWFCILCISYSCWKHGRFCWM